MGVLIELYDEKPICNVFAADALRPDRVVYIGTVPGRVRAGLTSYLCAKGMAEPEFVSADTSDCNSVAEAMQRVMRHWPDCMIDLTGGSDEAVFAAGRLSAQTAVPVIKCDIENSCVRGIYNCGERIASAAEYKIRDIIRLSGGSVRGSGHLDLMSAYDKVYDLIDVMCKITLDFHDSWYKQVRYFQQVMRGSSGVHFKAKRNVGGSLCEEAIMKRLCASKVLSELKLGADSVEFCFANSAAARLICDVGVWLELYVYKTLRECSEFTDAEASVVIDWDGVQEKFDVLNEVDVIAQKKMKTLFISCKTGPVSVEALNEIDVLCGRFGGISSRAVIVTATSMSEENLCTYKRACELGIEVVELSDLRKGRLEQILCRL